ncbi:MAG TPA: mannosyltransferase family protein [Rubrobacteraceae bacterium]|nr:mannosyltransferase family protein [Rubrobacteraceae bacterium]
MSRTGPVGRTSATRGTRARASSAAGDWPFVLAVFASSRAFFLLAGALAAYFLPWAEPAGSPLEPPGLLNYWAHWDGAWYSEIATDGYDARYPASTAFFPAYPMLLRLGSELGGGPALWGVLISLGATLLSLYFLYSIAEKLYDNHTARAATLAFAFFPTAFFLNAVYTESLFLALTTGTIWAAYVRRDLLLAGILGALAAATRNLGVLLLIPLFLEWRRNRREFGTSGLVALGLVPVGLLAYTVFLAGRFGDPFVFVRQQGEYWGRTLTSPLVTAQHAWEAAGEGARYILHPATLFLGDPSAPSLQASNTVSLVFLIGFVALMVIGLSVLPPGLSIYALIITLLPVLTPTPSFPLMSMPRFVLGAFPIFLVIGYLLARRPTALMVWLVTSALVGVALTALFTTWRWVA